MVIHAGANTTSKKVAEYGGNTFGFGSRSVLGSGWPKDLVRVSIIVSLCTIVALIKALYTYIFYVPLTKRGSGKGRCC